MAGLLAVGIVAAVALASLGGFGLWRLRESRRLRAAVNAFAERESLREPLRVARPRVRV